MTGIVIDATKRFLDRMATTLATTEPATHVDRLNGLSVAEQRIAKLKASIKRNIK